MNQYKHFWAQWNILNHTQYLKVKEIFGSLENAWKKISSNSLKEIGFKSDRARQLISIKERLDFDWYFKVISKNNIEVISIDDEEYPCLLKSIHEPPPFLFFRGHLKTLIKPIGVVGTRSMTHYGQSITEKIVTELTHQQFTIVSGLAMGIDTIAHQTTIKEKGITIAVLGSGVDQIYPRINEALAHKIIENKGVILSEYPIGTKPTRYHFPARNRIISGLSKGVLVTEGGVKSGALITAKFALEQGREVFAVPNNITKKELSGTNYLIRRGEAKLIENIHHILEEFGLESSSQKKRSITLSRSQSKIVKLIANEGKTIDELMLNLSMSIAHLFENLTELQIKGVAKEMNQKWVIT